jgi:phenylpropionate dioxygenase-like ring-hydroxylating dioxygenase large terminal subunit
MTMIEDLIARLAANVEAGLPDQGDQPMKVPAASYSDPEQYRREIDHIFLACPILVALSCEVREPGDYVAFDLVGRPLLIVRGDDGVIRTFLNVCRHRGPKVTDDVCGTARRFTCPYHSWSYDTQGTLVGMPGRETFGEVDVTGLVELPTVERAGAVFATLDPDNDIDIDAWLCGLDTSLAELRLDELHPYRVPTFIDSPNWKLSADGYLDGYHIGYLHRNTIGTRAITNRNTYDFFGPHVRIGFASKLTSTFDPGAEEISYPDYLSLVHYVFPNVSISGGHGDTLMMSRLLPGPTPDTSTTLQFQFYRQPVEGDLVEVAEAKRQTYEAVVRDEDCATIFQIGAALPAMGDRHFVFGRNEPANQLLHRTIAEMTRPEGAR